MHTTSVIFQFEKRIESPGVIFLTLHNYTVVSAGLPHKLPIKYINVCVCKGINVKTFCEALEMLCWKKER